MRRIDYRGRKNGIRRPNLSSAELVGRSIIARPRNRIMSLFEPLVHLKKKEGGGKDWPPVHRKETWGQNLVFIRVVGSLVFW